jgi:hypothetical protein
MTPHSLLVMNLRIILLPLVCVSLILRGQQASIVFKERFDTVSVPGLPAGWVTSTMKNPAGDFATSSSSPRTGSLPYCLSAVDARVQQYVITPTISFAGKIVDTLEFYERRTSSFTAGVLVEASLNGDTLFSIRLSDTLWLMPSNNGAYLRRVIPLPDTLNGQPNVRFRWRVCGIPGGGGTAVFRLDDVSVTVKKTNDLALTSLQFSPLFPRSGEDVNIAVGITNRAIKGDYSGTVELYDSLTLITAGNFLHTFSVQESISVMLPYPRITAGRHPLSARLICSGDEDTANNIRTTIINAGVRTGTALINEVMYTPPTGMPEWVEVVNTNMDTISVIGWRISDGGSTKALIGGTAMLPPHAYAVVTTDTNAFKSWFDLSAPLFQASFSALNNSGDAVVLYDRIGSIIDSLFYSSGWGGGGGRSLERIDTSLQSSIQSSWGTSRHSDGATPGAINSVTRKHYDAAVTKIESTPRFPITTSSITITATLLNAGRMDISPLTLSLFIDENNDSLFSVSENHGNQQLAFLGVHDSISVSFSTGRLPQGSHRIAVSITAEQDDDTTNNRLSGVITVGVPPAGLVITEIMYAPPEGQPEWIELQNITPDSITIRNWTLSDNGSTRAVITKDALLIPPGRYCLFTTDSMQFTASYPGATPVLHVPFSSLNNTTPDAVVLRDDRGVTMDSILYKPSWGGSAGASLQRYDVYLSAFDSVNWRSASPTAGFENAISRKDIDAKLHHVRSAATSDGAVIHATIENCGRQPISSISVRLFHDVNLDGIPETDELLTEEQLPFIQPLDSATVTFNWPMTLRGEQQIIVQIEYPPDQQFTNNRCFASVRKQFLPQTMVINEILYEPLSGNPEFIELLNRSADTIDTYGWKLMDQPGSSGSRTEIALSQVLRRIPPGGFILIASDSSVFRQFPAVHHEAVILNPSLSVSNNGEDLVLADLTGSIIDSLRYSPQWHLKNFSTAGRSLERIDPSARSTDAKNWSSSVAKHGSTPLQNNSIVTGSAASSAALHLHPNPFSPDRDGFEDFLSINYELPAISVTVRVRIYDVTGRLVRRLVQNEPLPSSGSVIWNGMDDNGNRVRIGIYIILFEALDHSGGAVRTIKETAVVARMLK